MISNLLFLLLGVIVGGLLWPGVIRPWFVFLVQGGYQRIVPWLMQRRERRQQRAAIKQAKQRQADLEYVRQPATRSPRTHTLHTRRQMAKASRQEHRDKVASLKKLKQRRNRGRIPLHVRVAPKGWRREDAA